MSSSDHINVLSFNCWGLALVAKQREFRLKAIAEALNQQDYHIITLQEVWVQKDFCYIKEKLKPTLPFAKYFYSGALGSGLAIFSRFPIIATSYYRYALNGKPLKFLQGDYYVGKGIATALVDHPTLGLLEIFNTHLHAGYGLKYQYKAHRAAQCWQLSNLLRASVAMGRHIILSGDFNSVPSSFNYQLICQHGFMTDSWFQRHGEPDESKFDMDNMTVDSYTQYFGFTCNSPFNTYSRYYQQTANPKDNTNARNIIGKRLDYVFYSHTPQLECIDSKVVLTRHVPGSMWSYSDHFGVMSVFKTSRTDSGESSLQQLHQHKANKMVPPASLINHPGYTQLDSTTIDSIITTLKENSTSARKDGQRLLYLLAFFILLQTILYIIVIVFPSVLYTLPHGNLPIILVTVFGSLLMNMISVLTPICLIVGFVFGHSEQRALAQFIDEIETFQKNALRR